MQLRAIGAMCWCLTSNVRQLCDVIIGLLPAFIDVTLANMPFWEKMAQYTYIDMVSMAIFHVSTLVLAIHEVRSV